MRNLMLCDFCGYVESEDISGTYEECAECGYCVYTGSNQAIKHFERTGMILPGEQSRIAEHLAKINS